MLLIVKKKHLPTFLISTQQNFKAQMHISVDIVHLLDNKSTISM